MNAIIPDLIFLGFTYMGFFVDRHVVPGRVGLLSMTLLVERTLINSIYSSLPEISYHCWLLDYLIVSFVLVFLLDSARLPLHRIRAVAALLHLFLEMLLGAGNDGPFGFVVEIVGVTETKDQIGLFGLLAEVRVRGASRGALS